MVANAVLVVAGAGIEVDDTHEMVAVVAALHVQCNAVAVAEVVVAVVEQREVHAAAAAAGATVIAAAAEAAVVAEAAATVAMKEVVVVIRRGSCTGMTVFELLGGIGQVAIHIDDTAAAFDTAAHHSVYCHS